jgi:hypothetical protein
MDVHGQVTGRALGGAVAWIVKEVMARKARAGQRDALCWPGGMRIRTRLVWSSADRRGA